MEIELKSNVIQDEYTDYIESNYDYKVSNVQTTKIPSNLIIDRLGDWNIGLILGASGSGKSTILKSLGGVKQANFDSSKSLISNFSNLDPKDATKLLCSMGLSSVPTWVRPYNVLSNGEQYRASLAKIISESTNDDIILIDEYTSVVDRNVAKAMSNSIHKYIMKSNKKIILASCHYDIIEWLRPNWIYDLNKGGAVERCDCLRQRPSIPLQVFRTECDTWNVFKKHHYMTEELNKSAKCFVFTWDGKIVGFDSILPMLSGTVKNGWREHRLVVLPDYQGMGIGAKISEFIGACIKGMNGRFFTKTINPSIGEHRNNSSKWIETSHNGKFRKDLLGYSDKKFSKYQARISYCHEYIGDPIYGYEDLFLPIERIRYIRSNRYQLSLF